MIEWNDISTEFASSKTKVYQWKIFFLKCWRPSDIWWCRLSFNRKFTNGLMSDDKGNFIKYLTKHLHSGEIINAFKFFFQEHKHDIIKYVWKVYSV